MQGLWSEELLRGMSFEAALRHRVYVKLKFVGFFSVALHVSLMGSTSLWALLSEKSVQRSWRFQSLGLSLLKLQHPDLVCGSVLTRAQACHFTQELLS